MRKHRTTDSLILDQGDRQLNLANSKKEKSAIAFISIIFIIWSSVFIYRSSFIALDDKRYFCLFDDAMISMRYAWNFSHGFGLVWNQGDYVQGYTNLLMVLLMSLATLFFNKVSAVLFIQILGAVFMLAIAFTTMKICSHLPLNDNNQSHSFLKILAFFCALSYYPLAYWSLMGMETGLLTLLLLLAVLYTFKYVKNKKTSNLFLIAGFLSLANLTRNDSAVFAILIWIYIGWEIFVFTPHDKQKKSKEFLVAIGLYLTVILGQLIFQYLYYGAVMPNTYTLKISGMPLLARIINGVDFVRPFLGVCGFILILSIMELVFDFQKQKLLLLSLALSIITYQIYVGGDDYDYWRIISPAMPLLMLLFIIAVNAIILSASGTQFYQTYFLRNPILAENHIPKILAVTLILGGLLMANIHFLPEISFQSKPYSSEIAPYNINTALVLDQLTTNNATLGVYEAGAVPYFIERKAIDFWGLSDKHIAQLPPIHSGSEILNGNNYLPAHNKHDLNYSIKILKPTYVQFGFESVDQDLSEWAKSRYILVNYRGVDLYLLKDSPEVFWEKINTP